MDFFDFAVENARAEFPVTKTVCAWCPGYDPDAPENVGKSHGMCPVCSVKAHAELDLHGGEQ